MINSHYIAFIILRKYFSRPGKIELKTLADQYFQSNQVPVSDRGFIRDLVYGVVRRQLTLDWLLKQFSRRKIEKISFSLVILLRLGIYQLIFLSESIPDYAAVNETAELAKKAVHRGTTSFVNGILRSLIRNKDKIVWPETPVEYLSVRYSYPAWLVKRWLLRYGPAQTEKIAQANNISPQLVIRTNTLKISREELIQQLIKENRLTEKTIYSPEGIRFNYPANLTELESFKEGLFLIQSESSQLVGHLLQPHPGELVLDACAGPGGKTTHLSQLMGNSGKIFAVDSSEKRLKKIADNVQRLGIKNVELVSGDICRLAGKMTDKFDKILVDAPCSSLGIICRAADVRWNKTETDLARFSQIQQTILTAVAPLLKEGGRLVYSVCTNEPEEAVEVTEKFSTAHLNWQKKNAAQILPAQCHPLINDSGELEIYPQQTGLDGFFGVNWGRS